MGAKKPAWFWALLAQLEVTVKWLWKLATSMLFWTFVIALGTCSAVIYTSCSNIRLQEEQKAFQWQRTVIYKIIGDATRDSGVSIDFGTIHDKFTHEAARAEGVVLSKKSLQEYELRRILLTLIQDRLIGHTSKDQYYIFRQSACGGEMTPAGHKAIESILQHLKGHPGHYTVDQLWTDIKRTVPQLSEEEYGVIINCLLAMNEINFDFNNKLYSRSFPPSPPGVPPVAVPFPQKMKTEKVPAR